MSIRHSATGLRHRRLFGEALSAPHPVIDTATYQRLREHLDDRELLELGAALSVASGWQRFIEAFGIRPDSWTEAMPLPWQEGAL